jgi:hypothetical protein
MYLVVAVIALVLGGFVAISLTLGQDRTATGAPPADKTDPTGKTPASLALVPDRKPGSADLDETRPGDNPAQEVQSQIESGAQWLAHMNEDNGRFTHGILPALNRTLDGDDYLHQLEATIALARAARYLNNKNYAAAATQAVLRFLDDTVTDSTGGKLRSGGPAVDTDHLAAAGLLVSAINELPMPQDDILDKADQLCRFIATRQQVNGALQCTNSSSTDTEAVVNGCSSSGPGQALCGLMASQRRRPAQWKLDIVHKALGYYQDWWRSHRNAELAASQTPAYAEAYLATKSKDYADAVFEMNDWLCALQYSQLDPRHQQWWGGFKCSTDDADAPTVHGCLYAQSLAAACRVARQLGDAQRFDKQYRPALELWRTYLVRLQYVEANTQHFDPTYRRRSLLGGFHASTEDGTLRIDFTAQAVCALLEYQDGVNHKG